MNSYLKGFITGVCVVLSCVVFMGSSLWDLDDIYYAVDDLESNISDIQYKLDNIESTLSYGIECDGGDIDRVNYGVDCN